MASSSAAKATSPSVRTYREGCGAASVRAASRWLLQREGNARARRADCSMSSATDGGSGQKCAAEAEPYRLSASRRPSACRLSSESSAAFFTSARSASHPGSRSAARCLSSASRSANAAGTGSATFCFFRLAVMPQRLSRVRALSVAWGYHFLSFQLYY